MPKLDEMFFAVCQTAIKNCAWKYSDFEAVKRAEGQLDMLRTAMLASQTYPDPKPVAEQPDIAPEEPKTVNEPEVVPAPKPEAPVAPETAPEAKSEAKSKLISPDEAKTAPVRPMPDEILAAVQDGIELAKNPPKVANVKVEALSSDPGEAEMQFNKKF